jgi:hypothetical protein
VGRLDRPPEQRSWFPQDGEDALNLLASWAATLDQAETAQAAGEA